MSLEIPDSQSLIPTQVLVESQSGPADSQGTGPGIWGSLLPIVRDCAEVRLTDDKTEFTFGRGRTCDVRFSDPHISTNHCRIFCEQRKGDVPPNVYIVDSSANGTFVNKVRLKRGKVRKLRNGDAVSLVVAARKAHKEGEKEKFAAFIFQQLSRTDTEASDKALVERTQQRNVYDLYDIYEELGAGTYATVRRCVLKSTGEEFAVKIINKKRFKLLPSFDLSSLLREADVLQKLSHPNIISLQDLFQDEDTLFIVTEYVTGGELFDRLVEEGAYEESQAKLLIRRLFEAIKYMHDRNIVHRDLKPENILIASKEDDTMIKVADFGVAKTLDFEGLKTFCGSPQYFAPEVLRRKNTVLGQGRYGKGADIWSLGVILYIVLSGRPPFAETTLATQMEKVSYHFKDTVWRSVSPLAKDLIRSLLNPDVVERATIEEALEHPWLAEGGSMKRTADIALHDDDEFPVTAGAGSGVGAGSWTHDTRSSMTSHSVESVSADRLESVAEANYHRASALDVEEVASPPPAKRARRTYNSPSPGASPSRRSSRLRNRAK